MGYRNRIAEHLIIDAAELRRNPRNFRTHPDEQRAAIRSLLGTVGIVKSLTAFYAPDDGMLTLIDGHARWQEGGVWPVEVLDLDQEEADLTLAVLDRTAAMADNDPEALMALLDSLPDAARQTAGQAWSDDELAALLEDAADQILEGAPESFKEYDENVETEYCCPKCAYTWSGNPK